MSFSCQQLSPSNHPTSKHAPNPVSVEEDAPSQHATKNLHHHGTSHTESNPEKLATWSTFLLDVVQFIHGLRKRYNEAVQWVLIGEPLSSDEVLWTMDGKKPQAVYGPKKDVELVVDFSPLKIILFWGGMEQAILNGHGLEEGGS